MDLRRGNGSFKMFIFAIPKVFEKLIKENPHNYRLHKALGEYYYDVSQRYSGRWHISDKEIIKRYQKHLLLAYNKKEYDYISLQSIGEGYLRDSKYNEGLKYLLKSYKLNHKNPISSYHIAYAYLYLNKQADAIYYGEKALELYKDKKLKSDAAKIIGFAYMDLKDYKKSADYFRLADSIYPDSYYILKYLLMVELELKEDKNTRKTTERDNA